MLTTDYLLGSKFADPFNYIFNDYNYVFLYQKTEQTYSPHHGEWLPAFIDVNDRGTAKSTTTTYY